MEPELDDRDVTSILNGLFYMQARLRDIAEDGWAIRLRIEGENGEEEEEDTGEDEGGRIYPDEWHEEQERSLRMLAERIAYYEARIAARERGDNPDAANAA